MKTKTVVDMEAYREAFRTLVAQYNAVSKVKRDTATPSNDEYCRKAVRDMADELQYTDAEMAELEIAWYD